MKRHHGIIRMMALALTVSFAVASTAFAGYWVPAGDSWMYRADTGNMLAAKGEAQMFMLPDGMNSQSTFCFGADGIMKTGWVRMDSGWYYFSPYGNLVFNEWIGGKYYADERGRMLTDTATPDGYYVGADGAWVPGAAVGGEILPGVYREVSSQNHYSSIDYEDQRYEGDSKVWPRLDTFSTRSADSWQGPATLTITKNSDGSLIWQINDGTESDGVFTKGRNGVYSGQTNIYGPEWGVERFVKLPDGRIQVDVTGEGDGGWNERYIFE